MVPGVGFNRIFVEGGVEHHSFPCPVIEVSEVSWHQAHIRSVSRGDFIIMTLKSAEVHHGRAVGSFVGDF